MTIETILVGAPPSPWGNGGAGGAYGGGGAGYWSYATYGGAGGGGAVRIVWPGSSRQFPSTCVGTP